jgi:dihydroorotase/N-acyl-D-amino-acid deacylase
MACMLRVRIALLLLSVTGGALAQGPPFDLLIRNAKIVDGSGNPWFYGDIGIRAGRIAAVGALGDAPARTRVDARRMVAAPGFIDIHTHGRGGIFESPTAPNYIRQGVTTLLEGQDGSSPLPLGPFLDKLSATPLSVNFGMFTGQGSIRRAVVGLENRRATREEIQKMIELAGQAMQDGAFGLSTGLFYVPGNYTPTEEIVEIARAVGALGGIYISHIREEASQVIQSVQEVIRIAEEAHLPAQVTHHKIVGRANWGRSTETLRLIEQARARGVDVTADQYPYTATSTGTAALFPQWALEGGNDQLMERLRRPDIRARIKAEIVFRILNDRGAGDPKNVAIASCPFDPTLAGKNLAEITALAGREPTAENAAETAIELQQKGGCAAVYHALDESDLERILQAPFTMVASDGEIPMFGAGVPHPRSYGTFARVLGRYVRERRVLTLEEAVRRMSSFPAARLGLSDRGLLRPGMKADLVIFDPARIRDTATFAQPHQYAEGVVHVFVNGKPVVLNGKVTQERPGEVIYGPARRP